MSLDEYERLRLRRLPRRRAGRPGRALARSLARSCAARADAARAEVRELRIVGPGHRSHARRRGPASWQPADGRSTCRTARSSRARSRRSAEGEIRFSFPGVFDGPRGRRRAAPLRGRRAWSRPRPRAAATSSARCSRWTTARAVLGEVAFGLNYEIDRFTRNILFDEKIGGTMHVALGSSFAELGGRNESALHWDLICDLRADGEVYADGELIWQAGPVPGDGSSRTWLTGVERLADVLVGYSADVRPGDLVRSRAPLVAVPLLVEIYREVLRAGGHPLPKLKLPREIEILYAEASDDQLDWVDPSVLADNEQADVRIVVDAETNTKSLSNVAPARQARRSRAREASRNRYLERAAAGELRWVLTAYPTRPERRTPRCRSPSTRTSSTAPAAPRRRDPVARWKAFAARASPRWRVPGRRPGAADRRRGHRPHAERRRADVGAVGGEGELPGRRGLHGADRDEGGRDDPLHVSRGLPGPRGGRRASSASRAARSSRLRPRTGSDFLREMIALDEGARRVGEFAFGLNEADRPLHAQHPLRREDRRHVHLALGTSYPETGGLNRSGLHWDMICDLRTGQRGLRRRRARLPRRQVPPGRALTLDTNTCSCTMANTCSDDLIILVALSVLSSGPRSPAGPTARGRSGATSCSRTTRSGRSRSSTTRATRATRSTASTTATTSVAACSSRASGWCCPQPGSGRPAV